MVEAYEREKDRQTREKPVRPSRPSAAFGSATIMSVSPMQAPQPKAKLRRAPPPKQGSDIVRLNDMPIRRENVAVIETHRSRLAKSGGRYQARLIAQERLDPSGLDLLCRTVLCEKEHAVSLRDIADGDAGRERILRTRLDAMIQSLNNVLGSKGLRGRLSADDVQPDGAGKKSTAKQKNKDAADPSVPSVENLRRQGSSAIMQRERTRISNGEPWQAFRRAVHAVGDDPVALQVITMVDLRRRSGRLSETGAAATLKMSVREVQTILASAREKMVAAKDVNLRWVRTKPRSGASRQPAPKAQ